MCKTVAVIDGNSLMHRAYHAIQTPMTALDGTPTNAIFGFMQMFCKFIEETNPDAVICAFDAGKAQKRIEELPEYKANRPHMDEELRVQFPVVEELLAAMEVPVVKVVGWEGDDILGTVAARDEALGYRTYLVTGDKDACQLVSPLTSIVSTKKGVSDVVVLDPDGVFEKYGVTPEQFPDYLGFMGDSSDNIPGVPGIGPKSAQSILSKYGSMEGAYDHIEEFKGKKRERLEENRDLAFLSRKIATIECSLDFELDIEGASFPSFEQDRVEDAFKRYSLMSPLSRVLALAGKNATSNEAELTVGELFEGVEGVDAVKRVAGNGEVVGVAFSLAEQATIFGLDLKCAFSVEGGCAVLEGDAALELLAECIRTAKVATLDLKETVQLVFPPDSSQEALVAIDDLYGMSAFDVGMAAYLLDSRVSSYGYDEVAARYLGGSLPEGDGDAAQLAIKAAAMRVASESLLGKLDEDGSLGVYLDIDIPLVAVLVDMERIGVELDCEGLSLLGAESSEELASLAERIYGIAGEEFNIDSPKQLGRMLFEVLGLPASKKNKSGSYSTDATVLRELAKTEEIASLVIAYREFAKIKGTYIDALPRMRGQDGRLHTHFHQTVTATGRLSSSNPNLQNIPVRSDFGRRIRECFVALDSDSVFMSADYSQIELRLLAHLSGDEGLVRAFNEGTDFHAMTAASIFKVPLKDVTSLQRSRAKAVNFGIVYGQQAFGLAQSLDIPIAEAKSIIDAYYEAYPQVRRYLDGIVESARSCGYAETMYGRKRHIPELKSSNRQTQALGERTAMNHPMQGSAADIIKIAMAGVEARLREDGSSAKLLLQVHDELDLSVPRNEVDSVAVMLKEVMEGVCEISVPLLVDVSWADNWAQAH